MKNEWKILFLVMLFIGISILYRFPNIIKLDKSSSVSLADCSTTYSKCYQNEDGTYSLFIYSNRMFYWDKGEHKKIDNAIVESKSHGYAFENKGNDIKTFISSQITDGFMLKYGSSTMEVKLMNIPTGVVHGETVSYENIYGDTVSAILYERNNMQYVIYPSNTGVRMEIVLLKKPEESTLKFEIDCDDKLVSRKNCGYIFFENKDEKTAIIHEPMILYGTEAAPQYTYLLQAKEVGKQKVEMTVKIDAIDMDKEENYPIRIEIPFEIYTDSIPDSSVYSRYDENSYLRNYTMVGFDEGFGEGWEYFRLWLKSLMELDSELIESATFHVKCLNKVKGNLEIHKNEKEWPSKNITWSTRVNAKEIICDEPVLTKDWWYQFDITRFAQECMEDKSGKTELVGAMIKYSGSEAVLLTTADNSLYMPYLKLKLTGLPKEFHKNAW